MLPSYDRKDIEDHLQVVIYIRVKFVMVTMAAVPIESWPF